LLNAHAGKSGLDYPNGAKFFLSFYDDTCTKQVIESILSNAEMCFGMRAVDVTIKENPDLTHQTLFQCASPFFIRRREGDRDIHYTYKDEDAGKFLEETLLHKMAEAGLSRDESLKIHFDVSSPAAKIKIISYRGIKNKVSLCPVIIEGCPETKLFAWNVGLGNSTGIGFGAIDL
jgi:CRISPR-associated endoribonuclease Cas6